MPFILIAPTTVGTGFSDLAAEAGILPWLAESPRLMFLIVGAFGTVVLSPVTLLIALIGGVFGLKSRASRALPTGAELTDDLDA